MAQMLDPKHPIIRRLVKRRYKVVAQAHLLDDDCVIVSYIAWHPKTKQKFQGRSRTGDWAAALTELAQAARLPRGAGGSKRKQISSRG